MDLRLFHAEHSDYCLQCRCEMWTGKQQANEKMKVNWNIITTRHWQTHTYRLWLSHTYRLWLSHTYRLWLSHTYRLWLSHQTLTVTYIQTLTVTYIQTLADIHVSALDDTKMTLSYTVNANPYVYHNYPPSPKIHSVLLQASHFRPTEHFETCTLHDPQRTLNTTRSNVTYMFYVYPWTQNITEVCYAIIRF